MSDFLFPHINESIENFLFDEEGNIPRSKILVIGSMLIIMGLLLSEDVYAAHRTHRTHSTHRTHYTHRSGGHMTHNTHSTHSTHVSSTHSTHSNHSTHSTHSNHGTHSTHSNSVGIKPPADFKSPYNIANKENSLLGTHTAVTSLGERYSANNLDITKIKK